jgi:hypothetical protein
MAERIEIGTTSVASHGNCGLVHKEGILGLVMTW